MLYQLSYILRGTPCLHGSRRVRNRYHAVLDRDFAAPSRRRGAPEGPGTQVRGQAFWRRAAMIFANDLSRISSSESPVASASRSVTAPHAMPRRK